VVPVYADRMGGPAYRVRPLDESTWPAFAALVEHNNGIFGGCWCMSFASALDLIAGLGGGTVEGYPEDAGPVPAGFLYNGALSTYENLGFTRNRKIGKHRWGVTKLVKPASG
jgi:hypothetical protein